MDADIGQMTFELPAVRLPPFGELAAAARDCEQLQAVRRLAGWTGERRVTKAGNLTLADARVAARELGLPDHPGARAARGYPELQDLWTLAIDLELLTVHAGRAELGAEVDDRSDREVVELWIDLLAMTLQDILVFPGDEARLMPLLMRLYVDVRGVTIDDLATHVLAASAGLGADELGEALASITGGKGLEKAFEPIIQRQVEALEAIDALIFDDGLARLTHLGRFGLVHWFEVGGIGAPYVTDLADASVQEVLDLGLTQSPDELFRDWLAALGPDQAAERILEHARGGSPEHRVVAFGMLNQLDLTAEKGVRACLDDRDLRPHANAWLSARGLPTGESSLDDLHRVFIDMVATDLDDDPRSEREAICSVADDAEYDAAALFEDLWQCEHPATLQVLEALARHYPDPEAARAARKSAMRARPSVVDAPVGPTYQLKVTLQDTKPPIWRRIQVPGLIRLSDLHAVLQTAMGWTNSHLHEFEIAGRHYGEIDLDAPETLLEAADHTLAELVNEGDRFHYLYDFGDSWTHVLTVEKILPNLDGSTAAVCLAGRRSCPPEDVGGTSGYKHFLEAYTDPTHEQHQHFRNWIGDDFNPTTFNLPETNAELATLPTN